MSLSKNSGMGMRRRMMNDGRHRRMMLGRRLLSACVGDDLELVGGLRITARSAQGSVMGDAENLDKCAFVFVNP